MYLKAYELYFGMPLRDQEKSWAPHHICGSCRSNLESWFRGDRKQMPFAIPRIWREPQNHIDDCYFCMVVLPKCKSDRKSMVYPNIPSSIAPVPHSDDLPVPLPPISECNSPHTTRSSDADDDLDDDYTFQDLFGVHLLTQNDLDDLIRDLDLTKGKSELLASRLQQWNLLDQSCRVSKYRHRHFTFSVFFEMSDQLCFCKDIYGLFTALGITYISSEWRLFIDSSVSSLKAVLLNNGNKLPSIPVSYSTDMKETYLTLKNNLGSASIQ